MDNRAIRFPLQGDHYIPLPDKKADGHVYAHAIATIYAEPEDLYRLWRREELLPLWMEGVVSVQRTGNTTSHWVMQAPGTNKQFEFDAEITEDVPGRKIATRVTSGTGEGSTDEVVFQKHPSGRGSVVIYLCDYVMPGGTVGNAVAAMASRSPRQMTIENLRHFKQLAEAGEIPNVSTQPSGKRGIIGGWKKFLMGETNQTPPGTSEAA